VIFTLPGLVVGQVVVGWAWAETWQFFLFLRCATLRPRCEQQYAINACTSMMFYHFISTMITTHLSACFIYNRNITNQSCLQEIHSKFVSCGKKVEVLNAAYSIINLCRQRSNINIVVQCC